MTINGAFFLKTLNTEDSVHKSGEDPFRASSMDRNTDTPGCKKVDAMEYSFIVEKLGNGNPKTCDDKSASVSSESDVKTDSLSGKTVSSLCLLLSGIGGATDDCELFGAAYISPRNFICGGGGARGSVGQGNRGSDYERGRQVGKTEFGSISFGEPAQEVYDRQVTL